MAYGIAVRTNAGFVNLATGKTFRKVHESNVILPSLGEGYRDVSLDLSNYSDLAGSVYMTCSTRRNEPASSGLYAAYAAMHNDDVFYTSANNIRPQVRIRVSGGHNPNQQGETLNVIIYAICV